MIPNLLYTMSQNKALRNLFSSFVLVILCFAVQAQEQPPRPMKVTVFQNLNFGAFIQSSTSGEVTIDPQGSRSVNGGIIPVFLTYQYYPSIFEVEAIPGSVISILNGPDAILTGSNGGNLTLHIGSSIPSSPFINTMNPPYRTQIRIGGTLIVGNSSANPSGDYIGYYSITFVQQ